MSTHGIQSPAKFYPMQGNDFLFPKDSGSAKRQRRLHAGAESDEALSRRLAEYRREAEKDCPDIFSDFWRET